MILVKLCAVAVVAVQGNAPQTIGSQAGSKKEPVVYSCFGFPIPGGGHSSPVPILKYIMSVKNNRDQQDERSRAILERFRANLQRHSTVQVTQLWLDAPGKPSLRFRQEESGRLKAIASNGVAHESSERDLTLVGFEPFLFAPVPYLIKSNVRDDTFQGKGAYSFAAGYMGKEIVKVYIDRVTLNPLGWSVQGSEGTRRMAYKDLVFDSPLRL